MTEPIPKNSDAKTEKNKSETTRSNLTYVIGILVIALIIGYYTQTTSTLKSDVIQDPISTSTPTPTHTPKRVRHPRYAP